MQKLKVIRRQYHCMFQSCRRRRAAIFPETISRARCRRGICPAGGRGVDRGDGCQRLDVSTGRLADLCALVTAGSDHRAHDLGQLGRRFHQPAQSRLPATRGGPDEGREISDDPGERRHARARHPHRRPVLEAGSGRPAKTNRLDPLGHRERWRIPGDGAARRWTRSVDGSRSPQTPADPGVAQERDGNCGRASQTGDAGDVADAAAGVVEHLTH